MTAIVSFSVPIYNLFCKVTGYGGTTSFSSEASINIIDRDIKIQFNADVNNSLNWSFEAPKNIEKFKVGENIKVEYLAKNSCALMLSLSADCLINESASSVFCFTLYPCNVINP